MFNQFTRQLSQIHTADPLLDARRHFESGHYDRAKKVLTERTTTCPQDAEAWLYLGNACSQLDKDDEARRAWRSAIEADPMLAEAYSSIAELSFKERRFQSAAFYWEIHHRLCPTHKPTIENLALCYERMGKLRKAFENYHKLLTIFADSPDSFSISRKLDMSRETYSSYIKQAYEAIGKGDSRKARECFQAAFNMCPGNSEDYKTYAALLYKKNMLEQACQFYNEAYALSPNDATILTNLGVINEKRGRYAEALWAFALANNIPGENQGQLILHFNTLLGQHGMAIHNYVHMANENAKKGHWEDVAEQLPIIKVLAPYIGSGIAVLNDIEQKYQQATTPHTRALELYKQSALTAEQQGQLDQAARYYQKIVDLNVSETSVQEATQKLHALQSSSG